MTSSSKTPSDLFAAKGRAMPACSKPLASRQAAGSAQAASAKLDPTKDKPQDDGPASVLSIDLRRALVPAHTVSPGTPPTDIAAPARAEPTPVANIPQPITPAPQSQGMAGPFIAALVAVSIAGGAFYIFERDRSGVTPVADAPAAASVETASPEDSNQASEIARPQGPGGNAPQAAEASESETEAAPADGSLPSFDLVRVEPDGSAVIAGRAAPYADLVLLHNGEPIGKVRADWAGEWVFVTDKPLPADRHQITILVNDPDAKIVLPEGAEPPAQVGGMGDSQPR